MPANDIKRYLISKQARRFSREMSDEMTIQSVKRSMRSIAKINGMMRKPAVYRTHYCRFSCICDIYRIYLFTAIFSGISVEWRDRGQ